jgi:uncharacterized membrane protein
MAGAGSGFVARKFSIPGVTSRIRGALAILGLVVAPIAIHIAMAMQRGMLWAGVLVVVEAGIVAWIALSFLPGRGARWVGCAGVVVVTAAIWRFTPGGIQASTAIPHAIAYLSVLAIFGTSLLPGRKPIVTIFAERSRGELPPALRVYTRRVTWAWCLFCAGQLLTSLLLLLFAPTQIWSAFVNLCNMPLLIAMFCGEFAWRTWRHGSPKERLRDGFRMAGQLKATTTHDAG